MTVSASEASIEAEIKTKNLTGPRLTPAHIDEQIVGEWYAVVPFTAVTICALTLRNGFVVVGHSAAPSLRNFDAALGKRIARDRAREQIWQLEGYLLREKLWIVEEVMLADEAAILDV